MLQILFITLNQNIWFEKSGSLLLTSSRSLRVKHVQHLAKRCAQFLLEFKNHMTSSWVNSSRRLRYPSWKSLSPKRNARENIEAPETMTKLKEKAKETWICVRFSQLSTKHVFKEESHIENILKVLCTP